MIISLIYEYLVSKSLSDKSANDSRMSSINKKSISEIELVEELMLKAGELQNHGKFGESKILYENALIKAEEIFGKKSLYSATIQNMIATILLDDVGKLEEAKNILFENKKIYENLINDKNINEIEEKHKVGYLTCLSVLANTFYIGKHESEALSLYEEYCEKTKMLNKSLPDLEMKVFFIMGSINFTREKYPYAISFFDKASKIAEKLYGENNYEYINYLKCLGGAYFINFEYQRALSIFDNAVKIAMKLKNSNEKTNFVNEVTDYINLIYLKMKNSK